MTVIDTCGTRASSQYHQQQSEQPVSIVTKTGFLDLPQEIKDLVYHELWKLTPNIHLCVLHMPMLVPLRLMYNLEDGSPIFGLPKWLLASMDFLEEGLRQLLRHTVWEWEVTGDSQRITLGRPNWLAGLSTATNLTIRDEMWRWHRHNPSPDSNTVAVDYADHPCTLLIPLLTQRLRVLTIFLHIGTHAKRDFTYSLSHLRLQCLNLDKLLITIKLIIKGGTLEICEQRAIALLAVAEDEVAELANTWISNGAVVRREEHVRIRYFRSGSGPSPLARKAFVIRVLETHFTATRGGQ
jgi:hypothetical protein